MGLPKFVGTGNAATDAQVIQANKAVATFKARVVVSGTSGAVTKTIPHLLGRTPTDWVVKRKQLSTGVIGDVEEALDGKWTSNSVELTMPGNGVYEIEFS